MITLKAGLPFLLLELEAALVHIGRGDVVRQLRQTRIARWTYDANADAAYLYLQTPDSALDAGAGASPGETISVYDELGINLDSDSQGRLTGIEILDGKGIIAQLEAGRSPSARG